MSQEKRKSQQWLLLAGGALLVVGGAYLLYQKNNATNTNEGDYHKLDDQTETKEEETIDIPKSTDEELKPSPEEIQKQNEERIENERKQKIKQKIDEYNQMKKTIETNYSNFRYKNGELTVTVFKASNLDPHDKDSPNDPWCKIRVGSHTKKTKVIKNTNDPTWNESFTFKIDDPCKDTLCIEIYDKDMITSDYVGKVEFRVINVLRHGLRGVITQPFHIIGSKQGAQLFLTLKYKETKPKN